jgi:hypothetical protein
MSFTYWRFNAEPVGSNCVKLCIGCRPGCPEVCECCEARKVAPGCSASSPDPMDVGNHAEGGQEATQSKDE